MSEQPTKKAPKPQPPDAEEYAEPSAHPAYRETAADIFDRFNISEEIRKAYFSLKTS